MFISKQRAAANNDFYFLRSKSNFTSDNAIKEMEDNDDYVMTIISTVKSFTSSNLYLLAFSAHY